MSVPAFAPPDSMASIRTLGVTTVAGQPSVILAHGTSLLRLRTEPSLDGQVSPTSRRPADDGRYLSWFESTPTQATLAIEDRATGRRIATVPGLPSLLTSVDMVGNTLWLSYPEGDRERTDRYEVPPLRKVATFVPPAPQQDASGFGSFFAGDGAKPMMVAVSGGVLSALDAMTGRPLAAPTTLGPPGEFSLASGIVPVAPRPGRPPGQLAVAGTRDVEIWDALSSREVATIPVSPSGFYPMAFDPSGQRIAVLTEAKTIEVWSVEPARRLRAPIPVPDGWELIGIDADGYLDVGNNTGDRLVFIDLDNGIEAGSMDHIPSVDPLDASGAPDALVAGHNGELPYELPLTARAWHDRVCAVANRPFTPAERELLPPGADDGPPC